MAGKKQVALSEEGDGTLDELKPGTTLLHGQYTITRFLASGGFGLTYLAKDSLDRDVVIKECYADAFCRRTNTIVSARSRAHAGELKSIIRHFVKEAQSLAKLQHPNIVGVHQVFEDNDTAYMAIDYVDGRDLLEILEDPEARLTPDQIVAMTKKLLSAVGFIHDAELLHRDISPDNILIDKDGEPILIDFGAARENLSMSDKKLSALRVVKDGYSPQEFYIAGSDQGPWSDLYALAASLYHAVTGEAPVNGQNRLVEIAEQRADPYVKLAGNVQGYPKGFLEAIDKAMLTMPAKRLQSATEWLEMLEAGEATAASKVKSKLLGPAANTNTTAGASGGSGSNRALLAGLAGLAIVAVVGFVGYSQYAETQEAEAAQLAAAEAEAARAAAAAAAQADADATRAAAEAEAARLIAEQEAARAAAEEQAAQIVAEAQAARIAAEEEAARIAAEAQAAREAAEAQVALLAAEAEAARVAAEEQAARQAAADEAARLAAAEEANRLAAEAQAARDAAQAEAARVAAEEEEAARLAAQEEAARIVAEAEAARVAAEEEAARVAAEAEAARVAAAEEAARVAAEAEAARIAAAEEAARVAAEAEAARVAAQEDAARIAAEAEAARLAAEEEAARIAAEAEATRLAAEQEAARLADAEEAARIAAEEEAARLAAAEEAAREAELEAGRRAAEAMARQQAEEAAAAAALAEAEREAGRRAAEELARQQAAAAEAEDAEREAARRAAEELALEQAAAAEAEEAERDAARRAAEELALEQAAEAEAAAAASGTVIDLVIPGTEPGAATTAGTTTLAALDAPAAEPARIPAPEGVIDAAPVMAGLALNLPFATQGTDSTTIASLGAGAPDWMEPGQNVVSVNGLPVTSMDQITQAITLTVPFEPGQAITIPVGVEPDSGAAFVADLPLNTANEVALLNGTRFQTRQTGDTWTTTVTAAPTTGTEELNPGDTLIALMSTNEKIDGPDTLQTLITRELNNGNENFNFAVNRNGNMYLVTMKYKNLGN